MRKERPRGKKERGEGEKIGLGKNPRDSIARWKNPNAKREKRGRVAGKRQGVGKKFPEGNPRVWRIGELGPAFGPLSRALETFFFLQINLVINFRKQRRTSRAIVLTKQK